MIIFFLDVSKKIFFLLKKDELKIFPIIKSINLNLVVRNFIDLPGSLLEPILASITHFKFFTISNFCKQQVGSS